MSHVDNYILTCSLSEEDARDSAAAVDRLNAMLEKDGRGERFVRVDSYATGPKCMEHCVFVAAFNYVDHDALIAHMRAAEWEDADSVQLFVREQELERFEGIDWQRDKAKVQE